MTSEIVKHTGSTLTDQIEWTRLVTDGDRAGSILPEAYRGKPANVLIAVGLGSSMGLSPAESLYRIAVIKGKPSAAAELIAANVRKAGHKLRVHITEDPPSASCTIIRSDDPDEPVTITRDMTWAQRMGLAGEPNYKKQPATMLSYRAITACARLACSEALYGVQYTPDEAEATVEPTTRRSAAEAFTVAPDDKVVAMFVDKIADEPPEPMLTDATRRKMHALLGKVAPDDTDDQQRAGMTAVLGREVTSRKTLTEPEGLILVATLKAEETRQAIEAETGGQS